MPHFGAVVAYAKWLARDRDIADELVQDTMLRALRGFASFRGQNPKPWLLTIVRNRFYSIIRRRYRLYSNAEPQEHADRMDGQHHAEADPETMMAHRELMRSVDAFLAGLPDEFREVLLLRELDGLSYREISERTNTPVGTVMSRLHRARAMLRAGLAAGNFM